MFELEAGAAQPSVAATRLTLEPPVSSAGSWSAKYASVFDSPRNKPDRRRVQCVGPTLAQVPISITNTSHAVFTTTMEKRSRMSDKFLLTVKQLAVLLPVDAASIFVGKGVVVRRARLTRRPSNEQRYTP